MKVTGTTGCVTDAQVPMQIIGTHDQTVADDPDARLTDQKDSQKGGPQLVVGPHPPDMATGSIEPITASYVKVKDPRAAKSSTELAIGFCTAFSLIAIVTVAFSLYGSSWIFSRAGFKGWCIFSFIWVWCSSMLLCICWPLIESRETIVQVVEGLFGAGSRK